MALSSFRPWGHEDGIQSGHRRRPVAVASGVRSSKVIPRQSGTLLLVCSDADELACETWPGDAVARDSVQDVVVVVVLLLYVSFDGS